MRIILAAALALAIPAGTAFAKTEKALVAGGCFWCVEADFERVKGVTEVVSGFAGGTTANPTYDDHAGHIESVEITYDSSVISYDEILRLFLRSIDVTDDGGQFCDRGSSYVSAIFVHDDAQRASAKTAIDQAEKHLGQAVVTPIKAATRFWPAEAYHQDYWKSSDIVLTRAGPKTKQNAYKFYRKACGRDARLKALWGAETPFAK